MNNYPNHHWISRNFIKRFSYNGRLNNVYQYAIDTNKWEIAGPNNTFCHPGWTQLIIDGKVNDDIEKEFGKVETNLKQMFEALDKVADGKTNIVPENQYNNMCFYFAFLHFLSPFATGISTKRFYEDFHEQLENGQGDLLLKLTPSQIVICQSEIEQGNKIVWRSDTDSAAQAMFHIQFRRLYLGLA